MNGLLKLKKSKKRYSVSVILLAAVFMCSFFIAGCDDFSFYTELDGTEGLRLDYPGGIVTGMLKIIPEEAAVPIKTSYQFDAEGGFEPYLFSVVSGPGTINGETGVFNPGSIPGESVIAVTDSSGAVVEADVTILDVGEFTISPVSLSIYINNTAVFNTFGGVSPFSWSMVSGSGTIDPLTGEYTAPSSPGEDTVRVIDGIGNYSDAVVTVYKPLSISPSEILVTVNNSYTFTAEGGAPPYIFSVTEGSIVADTGLYTAPSTPGEVTVTVTDKLGNSVDAEITVVPEASLLISPSSVTLNVNGTLTYSATGGDGNYEFSMLFPISTGTVDSLTGFYTASDTAGTEYVKLTDGLGAISTAAVTVVSDGPLTISSVSDSAEQNGSLDFSADGGTPPYFYSKVSGDGMINSSTGIFTVPYDAAIGSDIVTVMVTDAASDTDEKTVTILPAAPTSLAADGNNGDPKIINLSWIDNSEGEDGFIIERKEASGAYIEINRVGPDIQVYTDSDTTLPLPHTYPSLSPNVLYGYRIRAYKGAIESVNSNESFSLSNG